MPGAVFQRGETVTLRTLEDEDAPHLKRGRNDPAIRVFSGGPPVPFDEDGMEGYFEWLRSDDTYALAVCVDEEYVGMVTLRDVSRPNDHATAGVQILPEYQGNGYATEACELLFDYAFDQFGLHKVSTNAFAFNEPSIGLLESLGFTREGVRREERFANGEYHDVHHYGLLAREWRADG